MSEYATSWLVSLLRRLGYRRCRNSFTYTKSPVGKTCPNGVLESAMSEVKRQIRTVKFALEAHVGKIVQSHPTLRWIPTMAADAISFFWIGRDGLTVVMRRSGRAWKKLVAKLGESIHYHPAEARAVASGMQPKLCVGRFLGHRARLGSILIMTTDGVVTAAGFRRMNEESRWNVDSWNALRCLPAIFGQAISVQSTSGAVESSCVCVGFVCICFGVHHRPRPWFLCVLPFFFFKYWVL